MENIEKAIELRKLLDIMEGKSIIINWNTNKNLTEHYIIKIEQINFNLSENELFFLLDFFGFNSFYPDKKDKNMAIIQIPKLWNKSKELKNLLKDRHIQSIYWSYKKDEELVEKIDSIMRKSYDNMKTLYFAHPMKTYNTNIEKECLNIIEKEIGNKLPSSIKEIINPNSDEYRYKEDNDMHKTEEWGFSWENFANSMPYYCNLVYNSDGVIYLPIFKTNNRKNARTDFIRKITRGMKIEISYCTKLGNPLITFNKPYNNLIPTDINLPNYMIDYIKGEITEHKYQTNIKHIINNRSNTEIGTIENDIIKDINNIIIGKITNYKYINISCNKCNDFKKIQIDEKIPDLEFYEITNHPHKNCGGKVSINIYTTKKIFNTKRNIVCGEIYKDEDFTNMRHPETEIANWYCFKGIPYDKTYEYENDRNIRRYKSPYPFHMYINEITNEIHESPKDVGSIGGNTRIFEPWDSDF